MRPGPDFLEIYCIACKVKFWSHISSKIPMISHECYLGKFWIQGYVDSIMGKTNFETGLWADFGFIKGDL